MTDRRSLPLPWNDRAGHLSPLKTAVLAGLVLPAIWLLAQFAAGALGPRPVTELIHGTGDWAIRFLFLSLAVTPLRRIADWPKLILVRRMIGLAALFYALTHLCLYIIDQNFGLARVASEIALRIYLTIGFAALIGLSVLGATSTDAMIKKLGRNWTRLHRIIYAIGVLAALHFFMQTKADVYEATLMSGLFVLLMFFRILHWRGFDIGSPLVLGGAAILAGLATAGIEYAWYALATGVPPERVLAANLHFSYMVRPAWWVLATGLTAAAVPLLRPLAGEKRPKGGGRKPLRAAAG
ncbi:protein-methionine-sulfoxide reductase heme-binding subunit MsrQ [Mesorhizobium sp. LHD-90]|uniref:sulfite oxidase heme-binding subunit YedZ n=1 Tax=Mesorhizobium sp. LHD-90 TaxID=3071414 RepID=UPI0027E13926|nr:protein-methionine-sulfoxide reductase heme-binding subunit MsrQ [Mesorhizobium sp. LHD-90]MDQ6437889.1 protein-methionine-sulfoxide reductase heme-binding subunit MsrQ [Mesorhizobium sp. LHD-90]